MSGVMNTYKPDYAVHPGAYLEEILEAREIKKRDFAERIGLSVKAVSQIINGKALYSAETALQLDKTLGIAAEIWMNLADAYQLFEAREKERKHLETEKARAWVKRFPTADLKRLKILPATTKPEVLADGILNFFKTATPESWNDYHAKKAVGFRKSAAFKASPESTAVWLRLAELAAEKIETLPFDREKFRKTLSEIREYTRLEPKKFYPRMIGGCGRSGVALVLVPELKDTHLSGASEWLSQQKAMIAVSLRYKTNDHFWFTFFHEAAHLLLHGKKLVFLDGREPDERPEEREADDFAGGLLIPEREYRTFIEKGRFYKTDITAFAESIGLHPGIVAGRLQHDKRIEPSWHNDLKERWEIIDENEEE